jgi:hypothetical protein
VIVHGRFIRFGAPLNWIAAGIVRIQDGILVEHWDVIQDEATEEQSIASGPCSEKLSQHTNESAPDGPDKHPQTEKSIGWVPVHHSFERLPNRKELPLEHLAGFRRARLN